MYAAEMGYGRGIEPGERVELSPHLDLWMRGAKYGTVKRRSGAFAIVKLDRLTATKRIHRMDLKRV